MGEVGTILTSPDGLTWTSRNSGTVNWLHRITYENGTFVAVGEGGTILTTSLPVFKEWPMKTGVEAGKATTGWTIKFNASVSGLTINNQGVYIMDAGNNFIPVEASISSDLTVLVKPVNISAYSSGQTYTLYIRNDLFYGKRLKESVKMKFKIAPEQNTNPQGGDIDLFKAALEEAGFKVQEGAYGYQDAIALCSAGVIDNCMGANVGAPYLAYKLPPAPGQKTPSMKVDPASGLAFAYPLRSDEAVVQIGFTPPESAFFSYQSYLTMRYDPVLNQYKGFFNSIGDTINNLTINTHNTEGNPFNQPVIIISTADKRTDKLVRAAAQSAGYPSNMINTDVIPSATVNMGLEGNVDLFGFVSRIAVPGDRTKLDEYIANPGSVVLRLTPEKVVAPDPFPVPVLRVRGTGETELDLLPAVEELRQAILARYKNLKVTELPAYVALPEGFNATQSGINTIGDNRDAAYFSTIEVDAWTRPDDSRRNAGFTLPDSPEDFVIIYGVNHEAAGKATYANSVVYGLPYLNGVASVDSRTYQDSADDYIPGHPQAHYLYAWKIARNSYADPHCLEVPVGPQRYGIGLDEKIMLFFRAYLEKATQVGPAHNELIIDRVIIFSPGK